MKDRVLKEVQDSGVLSEGPEENYSFCTMTPEDVAYLRQVLMQARFWTAKAKDVLHAQGISITIIPLDCDLLGENKRLRNKPIPEKESQ